MSFLEYNFLFKILLIGDSGVGKSALLNRYCDEFYSDNYISTIGVDFKVKTIQLDGMTIKLQIWDTAGQERFKSITSSYYRGANAILCVFDLTDYLTFRNLEHIWIPEVDRVSETTLSKPIIFYVGTKCDLKKDSIIVNQIENYFETSSKKNIGIDELFIGVCKKILHSVTSQSLNNITPTPTSSVYIPSRNTKQIKDSKCC